MVSVPSADCAVDADQPRVVLDLLPNARCVRHSEGSFMSLTDGRLLFAYTRFGASSHDDSEACLAARWSTDGGLTWSTEDDILVREPGKNVMSVSLLRLADGRIGLFYLIKDSRESWRVLWRTSSNEARSFSAARQCSCSPGLHVLNNDRAVELRSGRLVLPVAYRSPNEGRMVDEEMMTCLLSDDAGETWRQSRVGQRAPGVWTQEPLVLERLDGSLWMLCRTQVGCQYQSESFDGGETWSPLTPSPFTSPLSPASLRRIPATGDLLLIWNNVQHQWTNDWDTLPRSPLHAAVSRDDGRTWSAPKVLESDPNRWFCYVAMCFLDHHVLLAYGAGTGRTHARLGQQRLTRVPMSWFYDA